ncbi:hypothetical protein A3D14_02805 [Candidatus Saccharibacteria bacterium RIFCSPHIGHO2_02_FULL_47_12]|nr:MAG: hypothetical protein A3D14_02805 [Candidatus Saccharibacteria bacterium RIFCSPHIGHO2_02_FULL_47_12]
MSDSIFTKIIKGEIPCHKIYEDDKTLAFLDIHPIQPGHTLVISKAQVDPIWDLDDEDYQAVMATCKRVASRIHAVLKPQRVGVQIIGVDVHHAHVHLIPFDSTDEFRRIPDTSHDADHQMLAEMAKKLAF